MNLPYSITESVDVWLESTVKQYIATGVDKRIWSLDVVDPNTGHSTRMQGFIRTDSQVMRTIINSVGRTIKDDIKRISQ